MPAALDDFASPRYGIREVLIVINGLEGHEIQEVGAMHSLLRQKRHLMLQAATALLAITRAIGGAVASEQSDEIPDVHFAIFRVGFADSMIRGAYEFVQPYRKSLPEVGFTRTGNLFWKQLGAGDFGYTRIKSRLTGGLVVHAGTVWNGSGRFEFPTDSMVTEIHHGSSNPPPDSFQEIALFGYPDGMSSENAWELVKDTDVIDRLPGSYEVTTFNHYYTVGVANPATAEWIIITGTHPRAPRDLAIIEMPWPRTLIISGRPTTPEIVVHNFSDEEEHAQLRFEVMDEGSIVYEETVDLGALPADSSLHVAFTPIDGLGLSSMAMRFRLLTPSGAHWKDAYSENNVWERAIQLSELPVFREDQAIPGGVPMDFDGDGDWDIAVMGQHLSLWENDGTGRFEDITARSQFPNPSHPRMAICANFTGNGFPDLLVFRWSDPLQLLMGDGSGSFTDVSAESGLSLVVGNGEGIAVDIENDGDMDLVVQAHGRNVLLVNDRSGMFTDMTAPSGFDNETSTIDMEWGDFNNDGFPDLLFAGWRVPSLLYMNDGTGQFSPMAPSPDSSRVRRVHLLDYDRDGWTDILYLISGSTGPSRLYRNEGDLTFTDVSDELPLPDALSADSRDINNDDCVDLIFSDGTLLISENGIYTNMADLLVGLESQSWVLEGARLVDIDNDGDVDVYSPGRVFLNQTFSQSDPYVEPEPEPITASRLYPSYPNPMISPAILAYTIHTSAHVSLDVYDVAGRLVRNLVDEVQVPRAELYEVPWDGLTNGGERVSSGIYFYRLSVAGTAQTRKMVVVR